MPRQRERAVSGDWLLLPPGKAEAAHWFRRLHLHSRPAVGESLPDGALPSHQTSWPGHVAWAWATCGGPAAFVSPAQAVTLRTACGREITAFPAPQTGVVCVGWTEDSSVHDVCSIILVSADGTVVSCTLDGVERKRWPLCARTKLAGSTIAAASVCSSGVVAVTERGQVTRLSFGSDRAEPQDGVAATADACVSCATLPDGPVGVVTSRGGLSGVGIVVPRVEGAVRAAINRSGQYLASVDRAGSMKIHSVSVAGAPRLLVEASAPSPAPPVQLCWCGTDAVAAVWPAAVGESEVAILAPASPVAHFRCGEGIPLLAEEPDGMAVLRGDGGLDFIHGTSAALHACSEFRGHAADLLKAAKMQQSGQGRPSKMLRQMSVHLSAAVETCVEAALTEVCLQRQSRLLQAAAVGKAFATDAGSIHSGFLDACSLLRITNSLRRQGWPLTPKQYEAIGGAVGVVSRLLARKLHSLALRVAEYSGESCRRVVIHWGVARIMDGDADGEVLEAVRRQFAEFGGLPTEELVAAAIRKDRRALAVDLVEVEPSTDRRIQGMIDLGEHTRAVDAAVRTGDGDLITYAVCRLWESLRHDPARFLALMRTKDEARLQHQSYCRKHDTALLESLLTDGKQHRELAFLAMAATMDPRRCNGERSKLQALERAQAHMSELGKDRELDVKLVQDAARLRRVQASLLDSVPSHHTIQVGEPLATTLQKLIEAGAGSVADSTRKDFNLSDRAYNRLKLRSLCRAGLMQELRSWIGTEKGIRQVAARLLGPPIELIEVVAELIKFDRKEDGLMFANRIQDFVKKAEALCMLGEHLQAAAVAKANGSPDVMKVVRAKYRGNDVLVLAQLDAMIVEAEEAGAKK
eukprot:TRINITY_DN14331_c0_g3_i1.p1 TRINITY_DN14331_c0_g3~~TRINITY_DN14331_c0_g3_i1.p1  ORF type:complete len:883 (+),score=190.08 TRINITY_DN14331_c0_g3_i1:59-2650(+)